MNNEELLRAMGMKPKTVTSMEMPKPPEDVTVASKLIESVESGVVPVPRRENPSKLLDGTKSIEDTPASFNSTSSEVVGNLTSKKNPTLGDLMASLIIQQRRTNTLLEQIRNVSLGMPISDSTVEVSNNGER